MRLRTGFVMLVASALSLASAPAATAAWGPELDVSSTADNSAYTQVAAGPSGDAIVAWLQEDSCGCYTLMARRIQADGNLAPSVLAVTPDEPDVENFGVAVDANGVATVAWDAYELPGDQAAIQTRRIFPDGTMSPIETLATGDNSFYFYNAVRVGIAQDGTATVGWLSFNADTDVDEALARRVSPDGTPSPTTMNLSGDVEPFDQELAVSPNGETLVTWTTPDDASIVSIDASGTAGAPATVTTSDDVENLALAINAADQGVVSWYETAVADDIRARTIDSGGTLGAVHDVASAPKFDLLPPSAGIAGNGDVTVVYSESDGSDYRALAGKLPHGTAFQPPITLSESGRSAVAAKIAVQPDGTAMATWQWGDPCSLPDGDGDVVQCDAEETPSSVYTIQARRIEANGTLLETADLSTGDEATVPEIAIDGNGVATVAWTYTEMFSGMIRARQLGVLPLPSCTAGSATTTAGVAKTLALDCSGAGASISIVGGPSHGSVGSVDQSAKTVTYTPATGYVGNDNFSFKATNSSGSSTTAQYSITVAPPPLTLLNLKVSKKKLPKRGKRKALKFDFDLSENASVKMTLERKFGRSARAACKRTTRRNVKRKRCPIYRLVTTRSMQGAAGADTMKLSSKFLKTLHPGAYRASFVATDSYGQTSTARTSFIVSWRGGRH